MNSGENATTKGWSQPDFWANLEAALTWIAYAMKNGTNVGMKTTAGTALESISRTPRLA